MARQKGISISRLEEIIDLMRTKRVAKLCIPNTCDIVMFEPLPSNPGAGFDFPDFPSENEKTDDKDLLLHSAR